MIVDSAGSEGTVAARNEIRINVLTTIDLSPIVTGHSVEKTDTIALRGGRSIWYEASHLKGFVCCDNGQTLSWISLSCLFRGHVEEASIEVTRILNKAAVWYLTCILLLASWVIVGLNVEPIFGNGPMNIETLV